MTTESMIGQVLEPAFRELPPEVARQMIDLKTDEQLQDRIETLAGKANDGELTDAERHECASYVKAGDILATLQAIARRSLQQKPV